MDPMMPAILHSLIPIFAVLAVFGFPVGLIWVIKNHQFRMKELELESHRPPARIEERLVKPMTRGAWPWFEVYASRIT